MEVPSESPTNKGFQHKQGASLFTDAATILKTVNFLFPKMANLDYAALQQSYHFTATHDSLMGSSPSIKF